MDVSALEPQIRDILSAPGIDLQTISAKRVRRGHATVLQDTLPMNMGRFDVSSMREADDHVILNKVPARRLPMLGVLQRADDVLRSAVHFLDLLQLAQATEGADETGSDE
ncbi:hypothetical protein NUW54_g10434 [Trametes sanguinea]|uniref:Uncharacterized protein n=1 Tax=Trametes sanguinea TaxID=158606 RepID=A0ACC1P0B5_9APHY|nr:hypothetical protein NUW54_g10434 [Trametes sanguinea]